MRMNDFFKAHRVLWVLIAIMAIFALAMVGCGGDADDDDDDDDVETPVTPPPPPPPPGSEENPYTLVEGEWADMDTGIDCSFAERDPSAQMWFKINVIMNTKYNVFWDDDYSAGSGYCDADIRVRANYSGESSYIITADGGTASPLGDPANTTQNTGVDTAYTSAAIGAANGGQTFTADRTGTVLIRVIQEPNTSYGKYPNDTTPGEGNFDIIFSTGNTVPTNIKPFIPSRN